MFLTLQRRLTAARDERGSAMVAVIGVVLITLIVTTVIAASVIQAIGFSTATRANVQSQAAAEAGLAVAQASLLRGECTTGIYSSTGDPSYYVEIRYTKGGVEQIGCPEEGSSRVDIVANGDATHPGQGVTYGDESNVTASYVSTGSSVPGSGAAIYAYSATGFGGSGSLVSMTGDEATVHIKDGSVSCDGASSVPDSFVIANGGLTATGSCNINGSVWASGKVKLTGSLSVGGEVVASDLEMTGSSRVGGTAWITGHTEMAWSTRVGGHLTTKTFDGKNPPGNTPAGRTVIASGPPVKPLPTVADWIDFPYDPSMWPGFAVQTISGNCSNSGAFNMIQNAVNAMAGGPGILDARGCTGPFKPSQYQTLKLKGDLAIFAYDFELGNSFKIDADDDYKLWLITPDEVADGVPTCPSGSEMHLSGTFANSPSTIGLIYTPCKATIGASNLWYGQVFAGQTSVSGAASIHFAPVGLPGYDLATGGSSGGQPLDVLLQTPTVVRNTSGG